VYSASSIATPPGFHLFACRAWQPTLDDHGTVSGFEDMAQKLKLKSWDEIPERQVYGGMAATDPAGAGGAADL